MRVPETDAPAFRARKRFGQHFLVDELTIAAIVELIAPRPDQHIVEIGPGGGVLTRPLLAAGAWVHAIEIDRDLAAELPTRLPDRERFELSTMDVLKFDWSTLGSRAPRWRVVGNLPYNISTPLILLLISQAAMFEDIVIMVQREVAQRLVAEPGSKQYGRLSVMTRHRADPSLLLDIGPQAFRPPPKVDSAIVRLVPHTPAIEGQAQLHFTTIVRAAFGARRKTLANALRGLVTTPQFGAADIDPGRRAESVAVGEFERLAQIVCETTQTET